MGTIGGTIYTTINPYTGWTGFTGYASNGKYFPNDISASYKGVDLGSPNLPFGNVWAGTIQAQEGHFSSNSITLGFSGPNENFVKLSNLNGSLLTSNTITLGSKASVENQSFVELSNFNGSLLAPTVMIGSTGPNQSVSLSNFNGSLLAPIVTIGSTDPNQSVSLSHLNGGLSVQSLITGYDHNSYSVSIGYNAASNSTGAGSIAIGYYAGNYSQGNGAIAIGYYAGLSSQQVGGIAIGEGAAVSKQGMDSIAIGTFSGNSNQGNKSIAVGYSAGLNNQGCGSVALGCYAGNENQGKYSVAIGYYAAGTGQADSSIIINAGTGPFADPSNSGLYINPVRLNTAPTTNYIQYNTITKELTYNSGQIIGGGGATGYTGYTGYTGPAGPIGLGINYDTYPYIFPLSFSFSVADSSVVVSNNNTTITASNNSGWTHNAYSNLSYTGPVAVSCKPSWTYSPNFYMGLTYTTTSDYSQFNYGIFFNQNGNAYVSLSNTQESYVPYTSSDLFMIGYDGSSVKFYKNDIVFYTAQRNTTEPLYANFTFNTGGSNINIASNVLVSTILPNGSTGYTGYQGATGYTGYQGATGYTGYQGATGYTGYQGATGYTGYQGATGYTGYQGATGYTGYTGYTGFTGYTGPTGSFSPLGTSYGQYPYWNTYTNSWQVGGSGPIALGASAGLIGQQTGSVALGIQAGQYNQSSGSVAIGYQTGQSGQGNYATAIGYQAGQTGQGDYSVAIGYQAGITGQAANSIVINASTGALRANASNSGLYIAPIRKDTGTTNYIGYNTSTLELTYNTGGGGGGVSSIIAGNYTTISPLNGLGNVTINIPQAYINFYYISSASTFIMTSLGGPVNTSLSNIPIVSPTSPYTFCTTNLPSSFSITAVTNNTNNYSIYITNSNITSSNVNTYNNSLYLLTPIYASVSWPMSVSNPTYLTWQSASISTNNIFSTFLSGSGTSPVPSGPYLRFNASLAAGGGLLPSGPVLPTGYVYTPNTPAMLLRLVLSFDNSIFF